jgi:hypothetical protein
MFLPFEGRDRSLCWTGCASTHTNIGWSCELYWVEKDLKSFRFRMMALITHRFKRCV